MRGPSALTDARGDGAASAQSTETCNILMSLLRGQDGGRLKPPPVFSEMTEDNEEK